MKMFLTLLIIIFSLQSWTKADDISELEIEGISIGDSLLDFYTEEQILNRKKDGFLYPNKEYFTARLINNHGNLYEYLQFQIKADDLKYIIYSIEGYFLKELKSNQLRTDNRMKYMRCWETMINTNINNKSLQHIRNAIKQLQYTSHINYNI